MGDRQKTLDEFDSIEVEADELVDEFEDENCDYDELDDEDSI